MSINTKKIILVNLGDVSTGSVTKEKLHEMKANGLNVFLWGAPIDANQNCDVLEKFQWVEANLGSEWVEKIIIASDKTMIKGSDAEEDTENFILVDQDGVLANFDQAFLDRFRELYPDSPFIPLIERRTFYPADDYAKRGHDRNKMKEIYGGEGFFLKLPLILGAKEALNEMVEAGLKVFICTAPIGAYQNCVLEKFQWVKANLGPEWVEKVILTSDKTVIKGRVLIDDKPKITGSNPNPEWTHVIFDQPYNREIMDKERLVMWSDWRQVLNLL